MVFTSPEVLLTDGHHGGPPPGVAEKHVVLLGLIAEAPIHAYGLEEKIRVRLMTKWADIGVSSIYRVLAQLEERGLVDSRLEHEGQGATRKVFAINAAGRAVLAAGVIERLGHLGPVKNPFQVGIAFAPHAPLPEVRARLHERLAELDRWHDLAQQGRFPSQAPCHPDCCVPSAPRFDDRLELCRALVFDYVRRHMDAERAFVADTLRALQSVDPALFAAPQAPQAPRPLDIHSDKEVTG